jgi:hypothetical protein
MDTVKIGFFYPCIRKKNHASIFQIIPIQEMTDCPKLLTTSPNSLFTISRTPSVFG